MKKIIIVDTISYLFILLFLYTGIMKLIDHRQFYETLYHTHLFYLFVPILTWLIPIGEIMIVVSLMFSKTRRLGLYSSLLLMGIFTLYVIYFIYFPAHRPCTCGGIISYMSWHQHLYFNVIFTMFGILAIWLEKKIEYEQNNHTNLMNYHLS